MIPSTPAFVLFVRFSGQQIVAQIPKTLVIKWDTQGPNIVSVFQSMIKSEAKDFLQQQRFNIYRPTLQPVQMVG